MGMTGLMHIPHDKFHFWTKRVLPNEVTPIWWYTLAPASAVSIPNISFDYWSVGEGDFSPGNTFREKLSGLTNTLLGIDFSTGELDFRYRGFFDLQGWIISGDYPLGESGGLFTATAKQIVDDYIRKVPVPYVSPGQVLTPEQQLQTVRESVGEDRNTDAEGLENVDEVSNPNEGEATSTLATIDQAAWYDLGPQMFFEHREWMGIRNGNGMATAEQKQRYAGNIESSIKAIRSKGKYAIIVFTISMPHINAMGNDYDEDTDPISIYDNWMEGIMINQYAPLDHMSMQDEISIANARSRWQAETQGRAVEDNANLVPGHWAPTANYGKYITMKRNYSVQRESFQQKPLQIDIAVDFTEHAPFMLIPNRM